MDKVKKQFRDFWAFYKLAYLGVDYKDTAKSLGFVYALVFITAFLSILHFNMFSVYGFVLVLGILAANMGRATCDKTSLISVAPFTPAQRIVFSYLTILLNVIFFAAAVSAIGLVVISIIALVTFCTTGENVFLDGTFEEPVSSNAVGVAVLFCAIIFFASLALSHIDKRKTRNIAAGVFFAVNEAIILTITNVCGFAAQRNSGKKQIFFMSFDMNKELDKLAHPWIVLVILGVVAAVLFGVSLYLIIKRHRSSKI